MNPDERAEIRARADAATPGPWFVDDVDHLYVGNRADGRTTGLWEIVYSTADVMDDLVESAQQRHRANAYFIARSRTDVERLLDALDEAERERGPGRDYVQGELNALCAALRDPSDEVVEAVKKGIWGVPIREIPRAAIAALARALGVGDE